MPSSVLQVMSQSPERPGRTRAANSHCRGPRRACQGVPTSNLRSLRLGDFGLGGLPLVGDGNQLGRRRGLRHQGRLQRVHPVGLDQPHDRAVLGRDVEVVGARLLGRLVLEVRSPFARIDPEDLPLQARMYVTSPGLFVPVGRDDDARTVRELDDADALEVGDRRHRDRLAGAGRRRLGWLWLSGSRHVRFLPSLRRAVARKDQGQRHRQAKDREESFHQSFHQSRHQSCPSRFEPPGKRAILWTVSFSMTRLPCFVRPFASLPE